MNDNKVWRMDVRSKSETNRNGSDSTEVCVRRPRGEHIYTPTEASCTRLDYLHLFGTVSIEMLYVFGDRIVIHMKRKETK